MKEQVGSWITTIVIIVWALLISIDYWQKHPFQFYAFERFGYYPVLLAICGLGVGLSALVLYRPQIRRFVNGLSLFAIGLVLLMGYTVAFVELQLYPDGVPNQASYTTTLGTIIQSFLYSFFIFISCYVAGKLVLDQLKLDIRKRHQDITALATGIMVVVTYLFFTGVIGQLAWYTITPLFVGVLALGWKHALDFLHRFWWKPLPISKEINWMGCLSFFVLFWVVILNFYQILTPMPTGSDAYILYVNVPGLIAENKGLISGYQPYNWSLFMSLGYALYGKTSIALVLSYMGGVLSLFAAFQLGRSWLKLDANHLYLALLLFYLLPTITHQSFRELKIDLGLLFMLLSTVLLFLDFHRSVFVKSSDKIIPYLALLGLMTGFGMGIKLTALFFFFALLSALWFVQHQWRGYIALCSLMIFALLLVRFDDIGGLRQYHLSANYVMIAMLLLGLGFLVWIWLKDQRTLIKTIRYSVIYSLFFILPLFPWMTKNYVETRSLNPQLLLNGKQPGPAVSEGAIIRAWNQKNQ